MRAAPAPRHSQFITLGAEGAPKLAEAISTHAAEQFAPLFVWDHVAAL